MSDSRFDSVVELFYEVAAENSGGGAAMAIYVDGQQAVSVFTGEQSPGVPWNANTHSVVFSCTKGLAAIAANQLIEKGLLDPYAKVGVYWPEFACNGKEDTLVKWVLEHKAGLSAVRRDLTFEQLVDGHTVVEELAAQAPLWQPGTANAYHALTFGNLVGELVRRVTGKTIGQYLRDQIAGPLNASAFIGLPENEFKNLAPLLTDGSRLPLPPSEVGSNQYWMEKAMTSGGAMSAEVALPGIAEGHFFNDPRLIKAELAGAGGVMTADALAKIYSACVADTDGVRLLQDDTIRDAMVCEVDEREIWLSEGPWIRRGRGFMLHTPGWREWSSDGGFGHDGLGGQAGFADVKHRIGFAYTSSFLRGGLTEQDNQQRIIRELGRVLES